jgi:hypothetical protein
VSARLLPLCPIVLLLLSACATRPANYEFKTGVSEAQYASDETSCAQLAIDGYKAAVAPAENAYQTPNAAGALGHGIAVGIVEGVERRKASESLHACMRDKGYSELKVSDEQWQTYRKLDQAQQAKARAMMAGGKDISSLQPH